MRTLEREQIAPGQRFSRDNVIGALAAGPILALLTGRLRAGSYSEARELVWTLVATWLVAFGFLALGAARERLGETLASRWQAALDALNASGPLREVAACAPGPVHVRGRVVAIDLMVGPGGESCVASFVREQISQTRTLRGAEGVTRFAREVRVERTRFVPFVIEDTSGRLRVDPERLTLIEPAPTREVSLVVQRGDIVELSGSVVMDEKGERVMNGVVTAKASSH